MKRRLALSFLLFLPLTGGGCHREEQQSSIASPSVTNARKASNTDQLKKPDSFLGPSNPFFPLQLGMSATQLHDLFPSLEPVDLIVSPTQLAQGMQASFPNGMEVLIASDTNGVGFMASRDQRAIISNGVRPGVDFKYMKNILPKATPIELVGYGTLVRISRTEWAGFIRSGDQLELSDKVTWVEVRDPGSSFGFY